MRDKVPSPDGELMVTKCRVRKRFETEIYSELHSDGHYKQFGRATLIF